MTRWPKHLRDNKGRRFKLVRWANRVRGLYGVPVYLVGSALMDFNADPRDWDVRIRLTAKDFERRFGPPKQWRDEGNTGNWARTRWRWSDRCVKDTKDGWAWTNLNIDFQIQPPEEWRMNRFSPRLRIDSRQPK